MQNHAEQFADRLVAADARPSRRHRGRHRAISDRFLSLVIVDYGTGIRVAAPTAVLASMTHAARAGIIIKSGAHMERLAEVDTVVFDKTGTLTHGRPEVIDVISYEKDITPASICWALPRRPKPSCKHPVADALRVKAQRTRRQYSATATKPNTASAWASRARSTATICMSATSASCGKAISMSPSPTPDRAGARRAGLFLHLRRGRWNARRAWCRLPTRSGPKART